MRSKMSNIVKKIEKKFDYDTSNDKNIFKVSEKNLKKNL